MNDAHGAVPPAATDEDLHDLIQRVRRTRDVTNPWRDDPARGMTTNERNELLGYWAAGYNWRSHEARIRSLPWELAAGAGAELRIIHQRSAERNAPAVVLLHGWPDSVLRFERLLPLLSQVHVVVPALPGFPFAAPFSEPGGASVNRLADIVADAMSRLGYQRYVVSGGDVGGMVAEILAAEHPEQVTAIHLTNIAARRAATIDPATLPADAADYLAGVAHWARAETGFIAEQSTRPSTLMAGLGDSPVGLAAWIGEKLLSWSDQSDGPAFTRDELLTWVTAYWLSGSIGTSFSTYVNAPELPPRIAAPAVVSAFARDIIPAPRSYVEAFLDVREFIEHPDGGHFGAWEQPQAYADDVRRALRLGSLPGREAFAADGRFPAFDARPPQRPDHIVGG